MHEWLNTAVLYQIYPQSYRDTNADGIGDLEGIIEKLDYIKALGCNAIWINPCYLSPFMDAGYDVADYYTVAPRYGNNSTLRRLFREAHSRGLRVLLDLVPGHTSDQHPWFKESCQGTDNQFSGRYIWTENTTQQFKLRCMPGCDSSNIRSFILGVGKRDGLCAVNYYSCQPCLNYGFEVVEEPWQSATDSPEAQATVAAIKDIMRFWLKMGCDGFRVDMAGRLVKNDPEAKGNIRLWQDFRAFLDKEFPQAVIVSEWGRPEESLQAGFHMDLMLHGATGSTHYIDLFRTDKPYFSRKGGGDLTPFVRAYEENARRLGGKGLVCIPSGSHDMPRMARLLDSEEMKLAFAFLLTMPGVPIVYYGDEIAMRFLEGIPSVEGSRAVRTGSRSPMQWDGDLNAGFSDAAPGKLYIPLDPDPDRPTVEKALADPHSLWHEIQRLIALRRDVPDLHGDVGVEFLSWGERSLVYRRSSALVAINPNVQPGQCPWSGAAPGRCVYQNGGAAQAVDGQLHLPPCSASVFVPA